MRVVFAGTPEFAVPGLEVLIESPLLEVVGVYTQPDRPAGRGKKPQYSPVKICALNHALPVFQPETLNTENSVEQLRSLKADLMIVTAYGNILNKVVLSVPSSGCINIHASLLPRWRGAAPIQRAIEAGDEVTGITLMKMDVGLDTGDMLAKSSLLIEPQDTAQSLHDKLKALSAELLERSLPALIANQLTPEPQNESEVTYAQKLHKRESTINWHSPAEVIQRRIHALNPWPAASSTIHDTSVKILEASIEESQTQGQVPGTIIEANKAGIFVATGTAILKILRCQKPGGKAMDAGQFINGMPLKAGDQFESQQ